MENIMKGEKIFVYGTLRLGQRADLSRTGRALFIAPDRVNGLLYKTQSFFPGVKIEKDWARFDPNLPSVSGEVFELTDDTVGKNLDMYEGFPTLFDRRKVVTERGLGVWIYTFIPSVEKVGAQLISDGIWN